MRLKTLTWNIGGGKLLKQGADATLLASYTEDGLDEIIALIKREGPDIITLQEVHKNGQADQAQVIAAALGYNFVHDSTSESHVEEGFMLGHAILTKFDISKHIFGLFQNPKIQITWEDGSTATSFDKGYTTCQLDINGKPLTITTLHLIPFRRFDIALDSDQAKQIFDTIQNTINGDFNPWIIQGDFNIDSPTVQQYLPRLFTDTTSEITLTDPTTPKNHRYDHVISRGAQLIGHTVIADVRTDHFPVITELEL